MLPTRTIAKKIEQQALAGSVTVSEPFYKLIQQKPFIWDTFDW